MPADSTWEIAVALFALLSIVIAYLWLRMPTIVFGRPEDIANEKFLTWWHLPVEIKPLFFQRKSVPDCAISACVHGGGGGTIVHEFGLCWETPDGPQTTVKLERNRKYFVPVSLRSTHWTTYSIEVNRKDGLSVAVPPRKAFFCDRRMILQGTIPMDGLSNEYHLTFRVHRSGKTLRRSAFYKLVVPLQAAGNVDFTFKKDDLGPFKMVNGRFTPIDASAAAAPEAA